MKRPHLHATLGSGFGSGRNEGSNNPARAALRSKDTGKYGECQASPDESGKDRKSPEESRKVRGSPECGGRWIPIDVCRCLLVGASLAECPCCPGHTGAHVPGHRATGTPASTWWPMFRVVGQRARQVGQPLGVRARPPAPRGGGERRGPPATRRDGAGRSGRGAGGGVGGDQPAFEDAFNLAFNNSHPIIQNHL
eukprot:gene16025-biopygen10126